MVLPSVLNEAITRLLVEAEARASCALDGETRSVRLDGPAPEGVPGLHCEECGHRIPLEDASIGRQLIMGLRCCGTVVDGEQAARLLRAARMLESMRREEQRTGARGGLRAALDRYGR